MITIMVILFLTILTGALIKTQSGAFALMRVSDRQRDARIACRGLFDFCLYQLEFDRNWGKSGFQGVAEVDPTRAAGGELASLNDRIAIDSVVSDEIRGRMTDENLHFRIQVTNALTHGSGLTTSEGVPVASEEVGLRISVGELKKGEYRPIQTLHTVLALAPLFDSSILTRGDLNVDGQEMFLTSKDPKRNEIRAQGNSDLPGLTKGDTRFVKFEERLLEDEADSRTATLDGNGLLYSGKDVRSDGRTLDSSGKLQATTASGGRIVSDGNKRVDIYELKPENIPQPKTEDLRHDIIVPPGEFRFTQIVADVQVEELRNIMGGRHGDVVVGTETVRTKETQLIDVCAYYDPPGADQPKKIMRGEVSKRIDGKKVVAADVPAVPGVRKSIPVEVGSKFYLDSEFDSSTLTADGQVIPEYGIRSNKSDGYGPVVIDLDSQSVQVAPGTRVRPKPRPEGSNLPPSAFELNVEKGPAPQIFLGTEENDVIFDADGDVKVGKGLTTGLGTVISREGNVDLQPSLAKQRYEYKYDEKTKTYRMKVKKGVEIKANDNYDGLVIYAGQDVKIKNPNSAKWTFRGFVYAQGKFDFDIGNEDATFFGSVVSRDKSSDGKPSFNITRGRKLGFIYDPEYLKGLTRDLPNGWTRLEPVVWNVSGN
jgi:hypothetical protein